jgi:hypothetical protein
MRTAIILGICLCVSLNLKTKCASQNHPTEDTGSEKVEEKEGTGDSDIFKPTHEWQVVRKGKFM